MIAQQNRNSRCVLLKEDLHFVNQRLSSWKIHQVVISDMGPVIPNGQHYKRYLELVAYLIYDCATNQIKRRSIEPVGLFKVNTLSMFDTLLLVQESKVVGDGSGCYPVATSLQGQCCVDDERAFE